MKITRNIFNCKITFERHGLAWMTLEKFQNNINDITQYPGCHTQFDCKDPQGDIAEVSLFQKDGKLFARGKKYTQVFRNPENVYEFLTRSKRVKKITLVLKDLHTENQIK